jgi:hypothetical protein
MPTAEGPASRKGSRIAAADIPEALIRAPLAYIDGATQVFTPDGRTIYTEGGSPTSGEWGVSDHGQFWSFWPPIHRSTYELSWLTVDHGGVIGIRFADLHGGESFEGRYVSTPACPVE